MGGLLNQRRSACGAVLAVIVTASETRRDVDVDVGVGVVYSRDVSGKYYM